MLRSSDSLMSCGAIPRDMSALADNLIITSGPHTNAVARDGLKSARPISWLTNPTWPFHSRTG